MAHYCLGDAADAASGAAPAPVEMAVPAAPMAQALAVMTVPMTEAEDTAVPMAPADKHHAALPMSLPRTQSFSEIKYTPVIFGISSKNLHHEKYKTRQEARLAGAAWNIRRSDYLRSAGSDG